MLSPFSIQITCQLFSLKFVITTAFSAIINVPTLQGPRSYFESGGREVTCDSKWEGWKHFFSVTLYNFQKSGGEGGGRAPPPRALLWREQAVLCAASRGSMTRRRHLAERTAKDIQRCYGRILERTKLITISEIHTLKTLTNTLSMAKHFTLPYLACSRAEIQGWSRLYDWTAGLNTRTGLTAGRKTAFKDWTPRLMDTR